MTEYNVPEHILISLLMSAFNHWISRPAEAKEYISLLGAYWHVIPDNYQEQIQREVHHKLDTMKHPDESGWLATLGWKTKNSTYLMEAS